MKKNAFRILLVIFLFLVVVVALVISGKLVILDVCSAKVAEVVPASEATKMSPLTEEEIAYFAEFRGLNPQDASPSKFSHEVMKCQMRGDGWPYFRW